MSDHKPLPRRLDTYEEYQAFDKTQAELSLTDPIQAVSNLRWMLENVWERWQSLDRAAQLSVKERVDPN